MSNAAGTVNRQNKTESAPGSAERFPGNPGMMLWFLRGAKHYFVSGALLSMLVSALNLTGPRIIGYTVDSVIGDRAGQLPAFLNRFLTAFGGRHFLQTHLYLVAAAVIFFAVLSAVCAYLFRVIIRKGTELFMETMRNDLYHHILRLPYAWHARHATGDLIQRCTSDAETINQFLSEQLVNFFRILILVSLSIAFMLRVSLPLTAVSAAFVPVIVGYSTFFHRRIRMTFERVDIEEGKLSSIAQENLTGVRVVRAFGRERFERERFEAQNRVFVEKDLHLCKYLSAYWASGDLITGLQGLFVVTAGAFLCVRHGMTSGSFIEFNAYNAMMAWPVRQLGRVIADMSKAGVSMNRIRYIMNAREEEPGGEEETLVFCGDISFRHVSFGYEEGQEVLHDVSFHIPAGHTVGILGGTGSGKSTLMHLLTRLYDLREGQGEITIDGTDIRRIRRDVLRRQVGMVLQEPYLFSRSLGDNIRIAQPEADEHMLREASRIAALEETVDAFTEGYRTAVGERGVTLSGGQKQRTAIAQMIIRKPPVMVFDDSLSAVDADTDAKIRSALRELTGKATVILIGHRITTMMRADNIIVLDRGKIAEQGTHAELLEQNGIYARIYRMQRQGADAREETPEAAEEEMPETAGTDAREETPEAAGTGVPAAEEASEAAGTGVPS